MTNSSYDNTQATTILKLRKILQLRQYSSYDNTLRTTSTCLLIKEVLPKMKPFIQYSKMDALNKFFWMQHIEPGVFCLIQWFVVECNKKLFGTLFQISSSGLCLGGDPGWLWVSLCRHMRLPQALKHGLGWGLKISCQSRPTVRKARCLFLSRFTHGLGQSHRTQVALHQYRLACYCQD